MFQKLFLVGLLFGVPSFAMDETTKLLAPNDTCRAMFKACKRNNTDAIKNILAEDKDALYCTLKGYKNLDFGSPLYWAIRAGSYESVELLIRAGVDVNKSVLIPVIVDFNCVKTRWIRPLHVALRVKKRKAIRQLLIDNGAVLHPNATAITRELYDRHVTGKKVSWKSLFFSDKDTASDGRR